MAAKLRFLVLIGVVFGSYGLITAFFSCMTDPSCLLFLMNSLTESMFNSGGVGLDVPCLSGIAFAFISFSLSTFMSSFSFSWKKF